MGYQNFFATKLFTDIGAGDTTITLETAPTATSGRLVLEARNPTQREIIKYTGVSGNQITGVTRGQGGTTAKSHLKNSLVEMNATAEDLSDALGVPDNLILRTSETFADLVISGGDITTVSGLIGAMANIVYRINGARYSISSIPNKTYTINRDTYVDVNDSGAVVYTEVANGAAAPALAANHKRLARVVTNGTTLTRIQQVGFDSLGNRYHNTVARPCDQIAASNAGIPSLPSNADAGVISCRFNKPLDIMTVGGKQEVIYQPLLRMSGGGVVSLYRISYIMRPGASYVVLESNSNITVGASSNYQNLNFTQDWTSNFYWATYDFLPYPIESVLRVEQKRDGASGADVNPGATEMEGCVFYYNRDYRKV